MTKNKGENKDYFKELGRISKVDVPSELDDLILGKVKQKSKTGSLSKILLGSLSMAVVVVAIRINIKNIEKPKQLANKIQEQEIIQNLEMLQQMEYLSAVEQVDLTDLTEEEWKIIMEEGDV